MGERRETIVKESDAHEVTKGLNECVCVWLRVHASRGDIGAMGSLVKRTIGVKLG